MDTFGLRPARSARAEPRLHRPAALAEALDLLARHGPAAVLLAGGQTLIPRLADRPGDFEAVVDLAGIRALHGVEADGQALTIGAMTTFAELAAGPAGEVLPVLRSAFHRTANVSVRNRATVGGTLALGEGFAELLAILVGLDAEVALASAGGERRLPVEAFLRGPGRTDLRAGEIIRAVSVPRPAAQARCGFAEVCRRASGGRALALAFARRDAAGLRLALATPQTAAFSLDIGQADEQAALRACRLALQQRGAAAAALSWTLAAARDALAQTL